MNSIKIFITITSLILVGILSGSTSYADDEGQRDYEVTITNLTRGQVITPPVVISHSNSFQLFTPGMPSIPELSILAEDGDTAPLVVYLDTLGNVFESTASTTPLLPGESITLSIRSRGKYNNVSVVGMLASTNDAFFAVQGIMLPKHVALTVEAPAYDAGSEANTESCDHIPGPPCGNHVRMTDGAEGYVHIHSGIHGIGDLDAAMNDWRNPVAEITVKPVR